MVTLEHVLMLGVSIIVLTALAHAGTDIVEYVNEWVALLLNN